MEQTLVAVLAVLGSLGGVALGSYLSGRAQTRAWQREALDRDNRDKRAIMSAFATAAREWRATVMSEDATLLQASTVSRSRHAFGGEAQAETLRRQQEIRLVSSTVETAQAAYQVVSALTHLAEVRVDHAAGEIPDETIQFCRDAEAAFLAAARSELGTPGPGWYRPPRPPK